MKEDANTTDYWSFKEGFKAGFMLGIMSAGVMLIILLALAEGLSAQSPTTERFRIDDTRNCYDFNAPAPFDDDPTKADWNGYQLVTDTIIR